jgi:hypothetical protein
MRIARSGGKVAALLAAAGTGWALTQGCAQQEPRGPDTPTQPYSSDYRPEPFPGGTTQPPADPPDPFPGADSRTPPDPQPWPGTQPQPQPQPWPGTQPQPRPQPQPQPQPFPGVDRPQPRPQPQPRPDPYPMPPT